MKKFDADYTLLKEMYQDGYFPDFLVDKVRERIEDVIAFLEMTIAINDLQEAFEENDSELETVARESIGETADYILKWFDVPIDAEDAIRERDW